jgi:hypothetical protein
MMKQIVMDEQSIMRIEKEVREKTEKGKSLEHQLLDAAWNDSQDTFSFLIEYHEQTKENKSFVENAKNSFGLNILHHAATTGSPFVIQLVLSKFGLETLEFLLSGKTINFGYVSFFSLVFFLSF